MSKNITIQEGGVARTLSGVEKIVTNVAGESGTQNWIPEDEAIDYINLGDASISENGTYTAADAGYDGFARVAVNVQPELTTKSITENGTYRASDDGADGYSSISVDVESGGAELTTKTITENGTYNAYEDDADGYSSVEVNVKPTPGGTSTSTDSNGNTLNNETCFLSIVASNMVRNNILNITLTVEEEQYNG